MNNARHTEQWFLRHFMASMVVFLLTIGLQAMAIELLALPAALKVVITLLPMAPLVWAFLVYRARFRAMDEYMQRLAGEAFLWATGIVSFACFGYGMLAMQFPVPEVSLAFVLPATFGLQGVVFSLLLKDYMNEK